MIYQFVCFQTSLPREPFLRAWTPFASSFLSRGLECIVLSEGEGPGAFRFISRNAWPDQHFAQTFRGQLPADAGGGPVLAVQAGGFRLVDSVAHQPLVARSEISKSLIFFRDQPDADQLRAVTAGASSWARYSRDGETRGGRFHTVVERYPATGEVMREVLRLAGL